MFSNLRSDVIRIENKSLLHGVLSMSCPQDSADAINIIPRLQYVSFFFSYIIRLTWNFNEMSTAVYDSYDEDVKQAIETYRNSIPV